MAFFEIHANPCAVIHQRTDSDRVQSQALADGEDEPPQDCALRGSNTLGPNSHGWLDGIFDVEDEDELEGEEDEDEDSEADDSDEADEVANLLSRL